MDYVLSSVVSRFGEVLIPSWLTFLSDSSVPAVAFVFVLARGRYFFIVEHYIQRVDYIVDKELEVYLA